MHDQAGAGPEAFDHLVDAQNPWPGLSAFTEENAHFFFGRDKEADELFRMIKRETLTVLFGLSGLGKTSLLQAGVFPPLRREAFLPVYVRLDYSPGAPDLVTQVKETLRDVALKEDIVAPPVRENEVLWAYFHRNGNDFVSAGRRIVTPVLVFDQFEEMFTLGSTSDECGRQIANLIAELGDLIENRPPPSFEQQMASEDEEAFSFYKKDYKVVFTLREDFLANLEDLCSQLPSIRNNRFRLQKMNGAQALDVVSQAGGALVDREVAEKIVKIVAGKDYAATSALRSLEIEPTLLSVFCRELNNTRAAQGAEKITTQMLSGSREAILTAFYERALHGLDPRMRTFIEDRLLTGSGYRNNIDLADALSIPGVTREAVYLLIDRRLLRIEESARMPRLELTHDVLTEVIKKSRDERKVRESGEEVRLKDIELRTARKRNLQLRAVCVVALLGVLIAALALLDEVDQKKKAIQAKRDALDLQFQVKADDSAIQAFKFTLGTMEEKLTGLGRIDLLERPARVILTELDTSGNGDAAQMNSSQLEIHILTARMLGDVLRSKGDDKDSREAETDYVTSIGDAEELAKRDSARYDREYAETLSGSSNALKMGSLADLYNSHVRYSDVLKLYRQSQEVTDRVAARHNPADAVWIDQQNANLEGRTGDVLRSQGHLTDALQDYRQSDDLRLKVAMAYPMAYPNDEDKRLDLANADFRLAMLESMLGQLPQAEKEYRQAFTVRQKYLTADPDVNLHRLVFYSGLTLGRVLGMEGRLEGPDGAMTLLMGSVQDQQTLANQVPANKDLQRESAFGHLFVGNIYRALGQWQPALANFNPSTDALRWASQSDSKNLLFRYFGSISCLDAGDAQLGLHKLDAALASYNSALDILQDLAGRPHANPDWPRNLSLVYERQGFVYHLDKNEKLASASYRKALDSFRATAHNDKENPNTFNALAWLLATCPDATIRQDNAREAVENARQACAISGNGYWEFLDTLAAAEAESGDFAGAVRDETAARDPRLIDPSDQQELTGIDSRLALYRAKTPYHMQPGDVFTNWDR